MQQIGAYLQPVYMRQRKRVEKAYSVCVNRSERGHVSAVEQHLGLSGLPGRE